jgi:hypothetical protein
VGSEQWSLAADAPVMCATFTEAAAPVPDTVCHQANARRVVEAGRNNMLAAISWRGGTELGQAYRMDSSGNVDTLTFGCIGERYLGH